MTEPEETAARPFSTLRRLRQDRVRLLPRGGDGGTRRAGSSPTAAIPNYAVPERAVQTLSAMLRYSRIRIGEWPRGGGGPVESAPGKRGAPRGRSPCRGAESARGGGVARDPRGVRVHLSAARLRRDERRRRRGVPGARVRVRGDEDRLSADLAQDGCRRRATRPSRRGRGGAGLRGDHLLRPPAGSIGLDRRGFDPGDGHRRTGNSSWG